MIQDMHLHSNYSDGQNSLEEMVKCSISLGIENICFTDHVWKSSDWIDKYCSEIDYLKRKYESNIEIFVGIEAKLLNFDGELDVPNVIYDMDVRVVGAMHRIPLGNDKFIRRSEIYQDVGYCKRIWMKAFNAYKNNRNIDCIAHPFSLLEFMEIDKNDSNWWKEVSDSLEQTPAKIEYNVKYDNSIVPEWFWKKHHEKIVPASDSHSTKDLIQRYQKLRNIIYNIVID